MSLVDIAIFLNPGGEYFCIGERWENLMSCNGFPIPTRAELETARPAAEAALAAAIAAAASAKVWSGKRDFDAEFTDAETYALEVTADPTLIVLRARLNRWEGEIRAEDAWVQSGLAKMVELGILTTQRKAAIDGGL